MTADPTDPVTAYAEDVLAGRIIAGPHVRSACKRHLDDIANAAEKGLVWRVDKAAHVIAWFPKNLKITANSVDGRGRKVKRAVPFKLSPYQAFIAGSLFGWLFDDGTRRFKTAFIEIGKGNGKTPFAAGIGLYMLMPLNVPAAEVYAAAADFNQANILFRDVVSMYEASPELKERLVAKGQNPIVQLTYPKTGGFFRPVASDNQGKSGYRVTCALLDEIHEHRNSSVIDMMTKGLKDNVDGLIVEITNSGFDKKTVCWEHHSNSIDILTGKTVDEEWFAYIAALDDDDDPFEDESCWIKANPNLGVSINLGYIRKQVKDASGMPSQEGLCRRLNFCQWTGAQSAAIPRATWEKVQGEVDADALTERDVPCFGGLDLSRTKDLSALSLTWVLDPTPDRQVFVSKTWFWTPADTLRERGRKDHAPYEAWAKAGHMEAVPGLRLNYRWLADALGEICARYDPTQIACDEHGLTQLQEQLDDLGIVLPTIVHPQGFQRRVIEDPDRDEDDPELALWMPDSISKLENAILEERITIDPNPVMTMCASSVVYEENRGGHRMFAKNKATSRIDGMVSLAMSIGMATLRRDVQVHQSIWDREDLRAVL